jgi:hypothetical protein
MVTRTATLNLTGFAVADSRRQLQKIGSAHSVYDADGRHESIPITELPFAGCVVTTRPDVAGATLGRPVPSIPRFAGRQMTV